MASPFVPFPMFCPYAQWRPSGLGQFPENVDVLTRLEAVDAVCRPFISIWYCHRYLAWLAHSWRPEQANEAYYFETIHLERLLNWSFSQGLSLLDLASIHLHRYAVFFCNPQIDWCAPAACSKFNANPLQPYENWQINAEWRPFLSSPRDASCQLGFAQVVINKFFDFYYRDVSITQADSVLKGFWAQPSQSFDKLTAYEMDWYLSHLEKLPYGEKHKLITLVYFSLARSSRQSRRRLIGSSSSPALLNQYSKNSDGEWVEMLSSGESRVLGGQFAHFFGRYLKHIDLDPEKPLPPHMLFTTSPEGKFARKCRSELVKIAHDSEDPEIREAVSKFQILTFSTLRKSSFP
ncbi:hypothetical protein [Pseudomonas sp. NPDC087336]|uniref:hypothetical protein n=1 Tax=Pseudomonas sp. NPDC087336 TaxID=3364436 RepID=UPI00380FFE06